MTPQAVVKQGKIQTRMIDINITEHCNLSCRGCNHYSPVLPKRNLVGGDFVPELRALAKILQPEVVKLLGGEPLLHPDILGLIEATRSTGISPRIAILTNGTLLPKAPEQLWAAVDEVSISSYPGVGPSEGDLERYRALASAHKVQLRVVPYDSFMAPHATLGARERATAEQIYATCRFAHRYQCHTLASGYFYKCPQAYFLPLALDGPSPAEPRDGVRITDRPSLMADMLEYLNSQEPLDTCGRCIGTAGRPTPHAQVRRDAWLEDGIGWAEDLVDPVLLHRPLEPKRPLIRRVRARLGPIRRRLMGRPPLPRGFTGR